jgi:hypothetical protein
LGNKVRAIPGLEMSSLSSWRMGSRTTGKITKCNIWLRRING